MAFRTATYPGEPDRSRHCVDVVAIYFPGFHQDRHYDHWFGEAWNEWQLLDQARPRFPGHRLLRPKWGAFDEADPAWMERQIRLAADHRVNVFLFDWYWYSGTKILHRPLEEGLLQAQNRRTLQFALMWANHDWRDVFPAPLEGKAEVLLPSQTSPEDFAQVMDYCIARYFGQPNYWRVDGGLYFSIFDAPRFVKQLGGTEQTRKTLDLARRAVRKAGLGKIHFGAFLWSPSGIPSIERAGFDSTATYNITSSGKAELPQRAVDDYRDLIDRHVAHWKSMDTGLLPHAPTVTVGWDPSPRWSKDCPFPPPSKGYPYTTIVVNNSAEQLGELCRKARIRCRESKIRPPGIIVNAWNEWTEGSSLLPEVKHNTAYLEALRDAFADVSACE